MAGNVRGERLALAQAHRPVPIGHVGRNTFLGMLGTAVVGSLLTGLRFLWPANVRRPGERVVAGNLADIPVGGAPILSKNKEFWLVRLDPADRGDNGAGGGDGVLALRRKCPHLGCAVPWVAQTPDPPPGSSGRDWFQCPCHGSTYTIAGVRVHGPAPRSLDTMAVTIDSNGNITVDTGDITLGGPDNPKRAVKKSA